MVGFYDVSNCRSPFKNIQNYLITVSNNPNHPPCFDKIIANKLARKRQNLPGNWYIYLYLGSQLKIN
jgi:hypothetical protein